MIGLEETKDFISREVDDKEEFANIVSYIGANYRYSMYNLFSWLGESIITDTPKIIENKILSYNSSPLNLEEKFLLTTKISLFVNNCYYATDKIVEEEKKKRKEEADAAAGIVPPIIPDVVPDPAPVVPDPVKDEDEDKEKKLDKKIEEIKKRDDEYKNIKANLIIRNPAVLIGALGKFKVGDIIKIKYSLNTDGYYLYKGIDENYSKEYQELDEDKKIYFYKDSVEWKEDGIKIKLQPLTLIFTPFEYPTKIKHDKAFIYRVSMPDNYIDILRKMVVYDFLERDESSLGLTKKESFGEYSYEVVPPSQYNAYPPSIVSLIKPYLSRKRILI